MEWEPLIRNRRAGHVREVWCEGGKRAKCEWQFMMVGD